MVPVIYFELEFSQEADTFIARKYERSGLIDRQLATPYVNSQPRGSK